MKNIWIRKNITNNQTLFWTMLSIVVFFVVWIILTTIRSPLKNIKENDYQNYILNVLNQDDIDYLNKYYLKKEGYYSLIKNITNREKLQIFEKLKKTKFYKNSLPNPIISQNVLPHPFDIVKSYPRLIFGTSNPQEGFKWSQSLFYAIWVSLRRELISFILVIILALPLGIMMSCNRKIRAFFNTSLIVGSFIPIAAMIPLTLAFFGIGELQKIIFLILSMFFVLLGLIIKEIDEVDNIYLNTAYTLGFSQWQTIFDVILPTALPKIWKHLSSVFGLGWGYIIFAEMINTGGGDSVNGIGWLFIARQRRFKVDEMYAIFIVIIVLAFIFSYIFKLGYRLLFKYEKDF